VPRSFREHVVVFILGALASVQIASLSICRAELWTVLIAGDPAVYSRHLIGRDVRKLEKRLGRPVILFEVDTVEELKTSLKQLTHSRLPIENLIVRGIHGTNFNGEPILEVHSPDGRLWDLISFQGLKESGVSLNFQGRTRVHFDSCRLIPDGDDVRMIQNAFREVLKLGHIEHGLLYMNQTLGADGVSQMFGQPFFIAHGGWKEKMTALAGQLSWIVVLPVYAFRDRFVHNQGYWQTVERGALPLTGLRKGNSQRNGY